MRFLPEKIVLVLLLGLPAQAFAQHSDDKLQADTPTIDPKTEQARASFVRGVEYVKAASWSEALSAFEQSSSLRPHATTTFNIAACERAIGRYTRARVKLEQALAEGRAQPGELAPSLVVDASAFMAEIDRMLVRLNLTVLPPDAVISVDGRPLLEQPLADGQRVWVAGVAMPGAARAVGPSFTLLLDPGAHIFTLKRKGYSDAVVNRSFPAATKVALRLEASTLPATMHVTSDVPGAIVTVDGADVGPVPVDVLRPGGVYHVMVRSAGFQTYETDVHVNAGGEVSLRGSMAREKHPLTKKWWFWTGAAAVVAGGVFLTYALTRPDPQPPAYDGGSAGWVVYPQ